MLQTGEMDVVTKAALANKDWVNKVAEGRLLEDFDPQRLFVPDEKVKEFEL